MSWRDSFYKAVKEYVEFQNPELEIEEVTSVEQDTYEMGGCSTCTFTVIETLVRYRHPTGASGLVTIDMSLEDFMNTI